MSKPYRDMGLLFVVSLAVRLLAILPAGGPGYMDAAYSYDIALNLAHGRGFVEPFLWNYLDDPAGLPHPSHLYWMPLPTLLAWMGLLVLGQSYRSAQIPFVIVAALLPVVSYWVGLQATGQRRHAWLAGLLTVFSGFYVPFWGHTDNFAPFALAGSLSLIAAWQAGRVREEGLGAGGSALGAGGWGLAAGALAGLAHLSRADGLLLLIAIATLIIKWTISNEKLPISGSTSQAAIRHSPLAIRHSPLAIRHSLFATCHSPFATRYSLFVSLIFVILGYVLVMLPWFIRNWLVIGAPLPAAGTQTIWLTAYDDLFSYGRELSPHTYLAWGWANILRSKLDALWLNLQTVLAVYCLVFLVPLVLIGWWRLRQHPLFRLAAWYAILLFLAMTFVFTFPGPRGGLFHSGGALLPFVFTAAAVGLDALIEWAATRRQRWDVHMARQVFGVGAVVLALLMTGFLYYQKVLVGAQQREGIATYARLAEWIEAEGQAGAVVMVGDPPGYWYYGGGPSIVVPNEPVETVLAVADRYGARYLVLDHNCPAPLTSLYTGEGTHPHLILMHTFDDEMDRLVRIFHIVASSR